MSNMSIVLHVPINASTWLNVAKNRRRSLKIVAQLILSIFILHVIHVSVLLSMILLCKNGKAKE